MANVLLGIHCVVPGCNSTLRKVNQWKARSCPKPKHKGKTQSQCMCPEPYQFFKFPAEIKLQKLWLERVRRPDLEINNLTRVCSLHFAEGKPTRRNYFPNINLHSRAVGQDRDNDEDVEEEQKRHAEAPHSTPTPPKIPRRGGATDAVSVVPMDLLQEGEEEEVYEGDLTISRFSYHRRVDEDNVSRVHETVYAPSNTVTITRVTTSTNSTGNGAAVIRTDNRLAGISGEGRKIAAAASPRVVQRTAHHEPVPGSGNKFKRFVEVREEQESEDFDYPYEIDMVEDDGEEGSELSDSGQGHQEERYPVATGTSNNSARAQSESRQSFKQATPVSAQGNHNAPSRTVLVKPKQIPVLAVAPKSQQQHQVIQPLATIARLETGSVTRKATPIQSKQPVPQSSQPQPVNKANPSTSNSSAITAPGSSGVPGNSQMGTSPKPLATYDPSRQQLQIANPVKYIQECHARIAELVAENGKLKTRNNELEGELQELQTSNKDLRREILQNQAKRTQPAPVSTINIVPRNDQSVNDKNGTTTNSTKSRIRYVIRRPIQ